LLGAGASPIVLEDAVGRAQKLLLPRVELDRVKPLAAAKVEDLDASLHPGEHDPQLLGGAPLAPLPVVAHGWSSRFS